MKKFILLFIITLFLFSCDTNTVKVGFAGSLTGQYFELGQSSMRGFEIAIEEINSIDKNFQFSTVIFDDESSVDQGFDLIDRFNGAGVSYIIGYSTSNMISAVEYGMNEYNMLFISPTMSTLQLSNKDDLFIRVAATMTDEAEQIAQVMIDNKDYTASIIYDLDNSAYTDQYYRNFSGKYTELGGQVILSHGIVDDQYIDISPDIIEKNADTLLLITTSAQGSHILQELYAKEYSTSIALSMWTLTEEFAFNAGKSAEGAYGFTNFNNIDSENYSSFCIKYMDKFNEKPSFGAFKGYEATYTLYYGLLNERNPNDVKNAIINNDFSGVQTDYYINEYGDCKRDLFLTVIKDGKFSNPE